MAYYFYVFILFTTFIQPKYLGILFLRSSFYLLLSSNQNQCLFISIPYPKFPINKEKRHFPLARSETRKPWKSRNFFSEIFKSEFSILAVRQNRKLGNKKTRNNFSEIPTFPSFQFNTCSFSFLIFFSIFVICFFFSNSLIYICNYSSTHYFINTVRLSH